MTIYHFKCPKCKSVTNLGSNGIIPIEGKEKTMEFIVPCDECVGKKFVDNINKISYTYDPKIFMEK